MERILALVPVERRQRAVDLGACTGNSIFPLLGHFKELIAVEPDPLMAQELRGKVPGMLLQILPGEECRQEPASVDLVTRSPLLFTGWIYRA